MFAGTHPDPPSSSQREASAPSTTPRCEGCDLFYGDFQKAKLFVPGFSFSAHARTGLRDVHLSDAAQEAALIWTLIQSPPIDREVTLARQALLGQLIEKIEETRLLHQQMRVGYNLHAGFKTIFEVPASELFREASSVSPPRNRLQLVIEEHRVAADNFESIREKLASAEPDNSSGSSQEPCAAAVLSLVTKLEKSRVGILARLQNCAGLSDPNLVKIIESLQHGCNALGALTPQRVLEAASDESKRRDLCDAVGKFSEELAQFGALCAFAERAAADSYCKVGFDSSKPEGYQSAWNFLREKDGHAADWNGPAVAGQDRCTVSLDQPHIVLCGGNSSGKTFFMQRDFLLRLSAQSFGYGPAAGANIHHADSFVWVERTSPTWKSVLINGEEKQPSEFCREVLVHGEALDALGARCVWYGDESWTTTSSGYEVVLNQAEHEYLHARRVRQYSVSHNQVLLEMWRAQPHSMVGHFSMRRGGNSDALFKRDTLVAGLDQSHAVEVAGALGLDRKFLSFASQYLEGNCNLSGARVPEKSAQLFECRLLGFDERESQKKEARSLRSLISRSDELVPTKLPNGTVQLRLRSAIDRGVPERDCQPLPNGHSKLGEPSTASFYLVSENQSHFPAEPQDLGFAQGLPFSASDFVSGLLRHGITNDPAELAERQHLFRQLSLPGRLEDLRKKLTFLGETIDRLNWLEEVDLSNFPRALLLAIDEVFLRMQSLSSLPGQMGRVEQTRLINLTLQFIGSHCTDGPLGPQFGELLKKLAQIESLEIQQQELNTRRSAVGKLSAEEREILLSDWLTGTEAIRNLCAERGIDEYFQSVVKQIQERLGAHMKPTPCWEIDRAAWSKFIGEVEPLLDPRRATISSLALRCVIKIGSYQGDTRRPVGDLLDSLRQVDSIHLHQYANYLEPIVGALLNPAADGEAICRAFGAVRAGSRGIVKTSEDSAVAVVGAAVSDWQNVRLLQWELRRLEGLLCIAQAIRDLPFAPVAFHDRLEVSISDGWNILVGPSKQVSNDRVFQFPQQVEFLVSSNMSGKSFDLVGTTWSLLFAQATGYAPGSRAELPIFDVLAHVGRVKERGDLNLSAGSTEFLAWRPVLSMLNAGRRLYVAGDEPFSSTQERERDALNFALAGVVSAGDGILSMATHGAGFVEGFIAANPERARASHFETGINEAGEITFSHKKVAGLGDSRALEVAAILGLPSEILRTAADLLGRLSGAGSPS